MTRMDANEIPFRRLPVAVEGVEQAQGAEQSDASGGGWKPPARTIAFPVRDYDLAATLGSGQAFRWRQVGDAWEGIISGHHFRLRQTHTTITAELLGSSSTPATPDPSKARCCSRPASRSRWP